MAGDEIQKIEAVFGAISKIAAGDEPASDLSDAKCPKCGKSDFVRVSELYSDAVGRIEANPAEANVARIGGLSDLQIVAKLRPPRQKSVAARVILVAIPLGVATYYIYSRFGDSVGQLAIVAALVITVIVLLTSMRRVSDDYYHRKRRWDSLFMCRNCGQLVAS
jgi:hypothetical protein